MKRLFKRLPKRPDVLFSFCALSFSCGFFLYLLIEKLYKTLISHSPTHWSMGLGAGLAFLLILFLDTLSLPESLICLSGSLFITLFELAAGWLYNLRLSFAIWDYSDMPLNFRGQICLPFSLIWVLASFGILLFIRGLYALLSRFLKAKPAETIDKRLSFDYNEDTMTDGRDQNE